jgi:hypothetical protein
MQAHVWFLEAEPGKHPVITINSWMGISGHLEIIGAFNGIRHCRLYGCSDFREIALHLFRTSCYVFIYFTLVSFCHGRVLPEDSPKRRRRTASVQWLPQASNARRSCVNSYARDAGLIRRLAEPEQFKPGVSGNPSGRHSAV